MDLNLVLKKLKDGHNHDPYPSVKKRVNWLNQLKLLVIENEKKFCESIAKDFGFRSEYETQLTEILPVVFGVSHAKKNLKNWIKEKNKKVLPVFWFGKNKILPQPLGVIAIISPWNYPLQLSLSPTIGALAAGNRVLIKPSEKTPNFSELLKSLVSEYFDATVLAVVVGDGKLAEKISSNKRLDHIFFTGSGQVGKKVATSAGLNLVPVTLELGGKSPVFISESSNLDYALKRIVGSKLLNAGQTCVAPDYLMLHTKHKPKFLKKYFETVNNFYPKINLNSDYTSIIDKENFQRLSDLVFDAIKKNYEVYSVDPNNGNYKKLNNIDLDNDFLKYDNLSGRFPPIIILNSDDSLLSMKNEIFGPILPVINVTSHLEAIEYVNSRENPLALYVFGNNNLELKNWKEKTLSGGITVNDCLLHVIQDELPFGGVGESGYGNYRGKWGFDNFSKNKPIFIQSKISMIELMSPPYNKYTKKIVNWMKIIF